MRKRFFGLTRSPLPFALSLVGALVSALYSAVQAQQPDKVPRIGYLSRRGKPTSTNPDPNANAFRRGLRDLGYVEVEHFEHIESEWDKFQERKR
jgi:hypothetical protein